MYNSVHVNKFESHCHRFLWRNLETNRSPDVYVIQRVNMGDKPAGAISTETAAMFQSDYPRVAELLTQSTDVDDIIDSVPSKAAAVQLACDTSLVLSKAGFKVKAWHIGGESVPRVDPSSQVDIDSSSEVAPIRALGVAWEPVCDVICFEPQLNFSEKRKGAHISPSLTATDVPRNIFPPLSLDGWFLNNQ